MCVKPLAHPEIGTEYLHLFEYKGIHTYLIQSFSYQANQNSPLPDDLKVVLGLVYCTLVIIALTSQNLHRSWHKV
jgi:hypothetical protein